MEKLELLIDTVMKLEPFDELFGTEVQAYGNTCFYCNTTWIGEGLLHKLDCPVSALRDLLTELGINKE